MKKYMFEYESCVHTKVSVEVSADTEEEAWSKFHKSDYDIIDTMRLGATYNYDPESIVVDTVLDGACLMGAVKEDTESGEEE